MNTLTRREVRVFTAFADTVVAPEPHLPPVDQTSAADGLDDWLTRAPRPHALALRAGIAAVDLAPLVLGFRRRLHKLPAADRAVVLDRLEHHRSPPLRQAAKALKGIAFLCYYGDDGLMRRLGYDADANVARGRRLRAAEGRP